MLGGLSFDIKELVSIKNNVHEKFNSKNMKLMSKIVKHWHQKVSDSKVIQQNVQWQEGQLKEFGKENIR